MINLKAGPQLTPPPAPGASPSVTEGERVEAPGRNPRPGTVAFRTEANTKRYADVIKRVVAAEHKALPSHHRPGSGGPQPVS